MIKFFISEKNVTSDANIVIIKTKIKYSTHVTITSTFAAKSIAPHKFNLSAFASVESIAFKATIIAELFLTSTSATKSIATHKTGLTLLFISETMFNDANTAIKKREMKFNTYAFAAKSIASHKFNLSALAPVETSTSLLTYRFVLSLSSTYELYKKLYLTIANLYIRYALLNKSLFFNYTYRDCTFYYIYVRFLREVL